MATVFGTVVAQAVREWNNDGRRHEFNVHAPARKITTAAGLLLSAARVVSWSPVTL